MQNLNHVAGIEEICFDRNKEIEQKWSEIKT